MMPMPPISCQNPNQSRIRIRKLNHFPPKRHLTAIAMAMADSVTVSMGEEIRGVFSVIFLVSADVRSYENEGENNKKIIKKSVHVRLSYQLLFCVWATRGR